MSDKTSDLLNQFTNMNGPKAYKYVCDLAQKNSVSVNHVCAKAGVDYATIWRWKQNRYAPLIGTLLKFAAVRL